MNLWQCCCGRNVSADGQSGSEAIEESKRKEEELFCSELVAQQMLRVSASLVTCYSWASL